MRLLRSLLLFCLVLPVAFAARASETPAEHSANVYAQQELDAAPRHGNVPDYSLSPENLAKSQHLSTIHVTLHFVDEAWGIASLLLLLWLGVIAWIRNRALLIGQVRWLQALLYPYSFLIFVLLIDLIPACVFKFLKLPKPAALVFQLVFFLGSAILVGLNRRRLRASTYRWVEGHVFLFAYLAVGVLVSLPLDLYAQHLQLKYGLSVQSWGSWFGDQGKAFLLSWIGMGLILMLLFYIIRRFPRRWWLVFWGISIPLVFLVMFAVPFIGHVFNHYEPLQQSNPELVTRLEEVVKKGHMDIPPERMYLMKASEKTTTLNADVEGFGPSKRVVVWDTTTKKMTPDEILFVFGHESGHYVLGHIELGLVFTLGGLFLSFFLAYHFVQWALAKFGPAWGIPGQGDWAALAVLLLAFSLFGVVSEPIENGFSRHDEHAADVYGQEAVHGLVADPQTVAKGAFDVLGSIGYSDPNPSPLYEFWTYSHPSIGRRAAFARAYDPWTAGVEPKYFKK